MEKSKVPEPRKIDTLKDEQNLYFLLELLTGGELLWHMRRAPRQRVPPQSAQTCIGALLVPLQHMQERGLLYRDLKPTNIVFTAAGRLKLIDFGHAKRIQQWERSNSLCGTPHYQAPETLRGDGHGLPAQIWALGILMVEMMAGLPPFWDGAGSSNHKDLKQQILEAQPDLTTLPDEDAKDLAWHLLQERPEARQQSFPRGYVDVREHRWLATLDWHAVEAGHVVPDTFDFAAHAAQVT